MNELDEDKSNSQALDDDADMIEIRQRIAALVDDSFKPESKYQAKPSSSSSDAPSYFSDMIDKITKQPNDQFNFLNRNAEQEQKRPGKRVFEEEKHEVEENEDWNMIKAALRINNEATIIKSKYSNDPKKVRNDLFSVDFLSENTKSSTVAQKSEKAKVLTQQQKKLIGATANDDDKAEDMMLAFDLLNKYKKNPNFIQKELEEQKRKRDLVIIDDDREKQKISKNIAATTVNFNPLLTQEERHRQIQEKREKRKQEQQLKRIEEVKEKRYGKVEEEKKLKRPEQTKISKIQNADLIDIEEYKTSNYSDKKIEQLRVTKKQIDLETKEYEDEVKKVQEDIKKYKQEYLEQERAKRQCQQQHDVKKKLDEERRILESEVERSRKQMQEFKLNKMIVILNSTVIKHTRTNKSNAFSKLQSLMMSLRLKEMKLANHASFNRRQKYFRLWIGRVRQIENERELERYQKEKELLTQMQNIAERFRRKQQLRKVMRQLHKYIQQRRLENQVEQEQEKMKYQVDNFFKNLKDKVRSEEEKNTKEKADKNERDQIKSRLRDNKNYQREYEQSPLYKQRSQHQKQQHDEIIDESSVQSLNNMNMEEEIKEEDFYSYHDDSQSKRSQIHNNNQQRQEYSPAERESALHDTQQSLNISEQLRSVCPSEQPSQVSQQSRAAKLSTITERPKHISEMEMRAKERRDKRELLKKQYDEKKNKAEEEKRMEEQKKEEEKKKKMHEERELKRQKRIEEMKQQEDKKQQIEIERLKMNNAKQYYERQLLIKYGIVPFNQIVADSRKKSRLAGNQRKYWLIKNGFMWIQEGLQNEMREEELRIAKMMRIAERFNAIKIYKRVLLEIKKFAMASKIQVKHLSQRHNRSLKVQALALWRQTLPLLKEERLAIIKKENLLVYKFRMLKMGKSILNAFRDNANEERIEKDKKQYKDQMWSKVNKWLVDIDQKDNDNDNDGDVVTKKKHGSNDSDQENKHINYL